MGALRDPQPLHEFSSRTHARTVHAQRRPLAGGEEERLSTFAAGIIVALTNHRGVRAHSAALRNRWLSSLGLIHSSSLARTSSPAANHAGFLPREQLVRIAITASTSHSLPPSFPLPSSPSCLHPLHFHSVAAAALHSKESETWRRTTDGGRGGGGDGGRALGRPFGRPHYRSLAPANGGDDCGGVAVPG